MKKTTQILVLTLLFTSNILNAQLAVVSNTSMNVVYIGVDNPIQVAVAGYTAEDLSVTVSDGTIEGEAGKYVWRVTTPGNTEITVSANDKIIETVTYRVKRIPDPVAVVGNKSTGSMTSAELKAQAGVNTILQNFDFDAQCKTLGFSTTVFKKNEDIVEVPNKGAVFSSKTRALINTVKPGDKVYIENVRCKCPGDAAARKINSIVVTVK